ncbi:MAG: flagellar biosynthesis protein FliQ [Pseudomonadales bacterium]
MTVDQVVELGRAAISLTLIIGAPMMLVAIGVGLTTSLLQAVTQVQDQTLTFVPKIIAMLLTVLYVMPWIIARMVEYATTLVRDIPTTL